MAKVCTVNIKNIEKYYWDPNGNLYFRSTEVPNSDYELVDGFDIEELKAAIEYGEVEIIYVSGQAQEIIKGILEKDLEEVAVC